jgi:hypothetical protein
MRMMNSNARRTCTATDPTPTQAPSPCPRPRSPHSDARPLDSPPPRPCCHDARGSRGGGGTCLPWRSGYRRRTFHGESGGGVPNPREHRGLAFHGERAVTGTERARVTIRGGGRAFHGDRAIVDAASMEGSARSWKVGRTDQGRLPWTVRTWGVVGRWGAQSRGGFDGRRRRGGDSPSMVERTSWAARETGRGERDGGCRSEAASWMRWRLSFHGRADPMVGADSERDGAGSGAGFTMLRRRACFARALRGARRVGGRRAML